jgi:uncharacterized lipoprotein YajG
MRSCRRLSTLVPLLLLAACATTDTSGIDAAAALTVARVCTAFPAITYSSQDTPETVAQVQAHNRAHDALCPTP